MWPHPTPTLIRTKTVGIRALKNQLGEYVRVVQSGEGFVETSPVAAWLFGEARWQQLTSFGRCVPT